MAVPYFFLFSQLLFKDADPVGKCGELGIVSLRLDQFLPACPLFLQFCSDPGRLAVCIQVIFPESIEPLLQKLRLVSLVIPEFQQLLLSVLEFLKPALCLSLIQLNGFAAETVASEFFRINISDRHIAAKFPLF